MALTVALRGRACRSERFATWADMMEIAYWFHAIFRWSSGKSTWEWTAKVSCPWTSPDMIRLSWVCPIVSGSWNAAGTQRRTRSVTLCPSQWARTVLNVVRISASLVTTR